MGRRGCAAREAHANLTNVHEGSALVVFTCELCELPSPFSFYDQKPPNTSDLHKLQSGFRTAEKT